MRKLTLPSIIALLAFSASASAADGWGPGYAYADFDITTQVEAECSFEINDKHMAMGEYGEPTQSMGSNYWVYVHCSNGVPYTIAMDTGLNAQRRLVGLNDPTKQMRYEFYLPGSDGQTVWGDGVNGDMLFSSVGTGQLQQHSASLSIWTGWQADNPGEPYLFPADIYQDTITATLTY